MFVMKRMVLFVLFTYFLLVPLVSAENFTIGIEKPTEFLAGQTASLNVVINNTGPTDFFSISILGSPSWLTPEVTSIKVSSGDIGKVKVYVTPSKVATPTTYKYFVSLTSTSTRSVQEKEFLIEVKQTTPALIKQIDLSCKVCENKLNVTGLVENTGSQLMNVTLKLTIGTQEKTVFIGNLPVLYTRYFQEVFYLKDMNPDDYELEATLMNNEGKTLYTESVSFSIPTIEDLKYESFDQKTIFGKTVTLSATNKGNTIKDVYLKSTLSGKWYTYFSGPEPTSKSGNEYVWMMSLSPGESVTKRYTEVYWIVHLMIIVVIILIIFISYYMYTNLVITKDIIGHRIARLGKEISVSLHVKNRLREMNDVYVKDTVPQKFVITSKFETIKPIIRKVSLGTELIWKIPKIRSHEERILHYKIKPLTEFSGVTHLPSAAVKAKYRDKILVRKSNMVALLGEVQIGTKVFPVKVAK